MKCKLKKLGRSILSSVLCLVMLLTTIVFFDIGSVVSDAVVEVTPNADPKKEATDQVIFYVPEIIYLTPTTASTSSFQYELDVTTDSNNNYVPNGAYSAIGANYSIYFSYDNASNISLSYAWYSGSSGTLTINGLTTSSSGSSLTSKITSGTAQYSSGTTQYIWWTVTYTDTVDHIVKTVNQMTGVYSPMAGDNATVAAEAFGRRKSSSDYACIANSCIWAAGIHSISTPLHGQTGYDGLGSIKDAPLPKTSDNENKCSSTSTPKDDKLTADNAVSKQALTYISGGTGYSGYWRQGDGDSDTHITYYTGYYEGILTVDTSRVSNLNQIPNLEVGLDIYEAWQKNGKSDCNRSFGYNVSGSTKDTTNLLSWLSSDVRSSSLNGSRFRSQLDYNITSSTVLEINGHVMGRIAHSYPTIYLNCNVANKSSLRTEIANCIKYSNILQDRFYSPNNNQYKGYKSSLVDAMKALCTVDTTTVSDTPYTSYVEDLLNPSDSNNDARGGCLSAGGYLWLKQYTAKIFPTSTSGTYTFNSVSATSSSPFRTLDTLSVTPDDCKGYTYIGLSKCSLDKNTQTSDSPDSVPVATNPVFYKNKGDSLTESEMALSSSGTNTSTGEVINADDGTVNNKHATIESKYYIYYYVANTYNVIYNGNGHTSGSTATSTHTYDIAKNLNANGYKREYTVTFNYNGSGASNTTATATATFNGWATDATGTKTYDNGQSVINLSTGADVNLYANWTLGTVTLPNPTRTGYTFGGWYSDPACTNLEAYGGATYTPKSTLTLYAKWTANKYMITFDQQNGSGGSASAIATYDKAMPPATMPTRTGYIFGGYYTGTNGTGTQYYNADGTSANKWNIAEDNRTLYADWTNGTYKVTLDMQDGTGRTASVQATYDKDMPATTIPERTGYTFGGYYSEKNGGGTQYYTDKGASASTWNIASDKTLYAKWTAKTYKVTFDKQGGTDGTDTTTATYDEAMPSVTKPTRTGYTFQGYFTDTDGKGTQYYKADGTSANNWKIAGDTTLYAYWTNGTYTVTLDMQNGTGGTERVQATYDKAMPEAAMPKRTGYTFGGYYGEKNGGGTQYYTDKGASASNWNIDSDTTLYAKWTAISYTVEYDLDGGTAGGTYPTSATYDSVYLLSAPSRNGWTFAGWILLDSDANFLTAKYGDNANEFLSFSSGKKTAIAADIYFKNLASVNGNSVTLKAIWQKKGIVYFNYLNASSEKQTTTVDFSFTTDSPSVEVNIPNVASSVIYDGRTFTMRGWKQSYLPSDPATVSSDSTTVTVDSTGYTDVGDVYVNYYAMYDCDVTLSYNVNGGNSAAPASESKKQYINPTDKTEADSIAYTTLSFSVTNIVPTHEKNLTFIGWSTTKDGAVEYIGSSTITIYVNTTLYAVWIKSDSAEEEAKNQQFTKTVVAYGYNAVTDEVLTHKLTETFDGWDPTDYNAYSNSIEEYIKAKKEYVDNPSSIESINNYQKAVKELNEATKKLSDKSIVSSFLDNITITYKDGTETKTITNASVKNINLNHYSTATLDVLNKNYVEAKKLLEKKLPSQSELNSFVVELAKNYTSYDDIGSKPTVDFYETPEKVKTMLKSEEAVEAVNYLRTDYGYTYYCYVNSKTPIVFLNAVEESEILKSEIETASTTSTRLGYPTRATVTSSGGASAVTTKHLDSSDYSNYINAGIGSNYSGYVNGELLTGEYYYNAYTQIMLSPVFTSDKQEIVYTIKATDDALVWKTQDDKGNKIDPVLTEGINYATTANMSGETATGVSKTATVSEPSKGVTICFSYHNPGNSFDVSGDAVNNDTWLKQYHLFRSSGGASNWELPRPHNFINMKTGNPYDTYFVNDGTLGSSDKGSFFFTFKLGDSIDFTTKTVLDDGNIGYLPTLNTKDPEKIAAAIKEGTISFSSLKACQYTGTRSYYKVLENGEYERGADNKYKVYYGGTGYGFFPWPKANIWSVNYYPASGSYTYVHLVDRWGNSVDRVIEVGLQDAVDVSMETNASGYTILEEGGSGIDTLSLNSSNYEILADEVSTIENGVFTTQGNTVRISTGEANKSYTLTMTDKATNSSTATVKSDENGIITLSVEDTAYESGVYTFMLNSIEVNLYDGAETDKYVLSVSGDEVDEGEAAQITVTTKDDVSKLRFIDESGNTSTVSSFVQNDDGTRKWTFAKARPAGEYTYKITVKVGYEWLDEGDTADLIFNERILDSGKVRSAEYDEETGLYKVTFEGRATKVQFVSEDGMTRTYTRYADTVKSIKTYDADGNEVSDTARTLDHEVWYVEAKLYSGQNYTVVGKFEAGWNKAEDATSTVTGK